MECRTLVKLTASTLVLGVTMVGCKPAFEGSRPRSASDSGTRPEQQAGKAATAALRAAQSRDWTNAIAQAERAVSLSPRDAGFRAMLAEIYLKSGRFDSAAAAFADAKALNPGDGKATLSLALTQIGLGRNADALATLGDANSNLAPADQGLALALAGDSEGAIRILSAAAREAQATGRVRQNLALAHALAGDWTQARAIAAQDVAPDELDARMAAWAEFAQPKSSYDQVATLLGVTPVLDPGQPTRLALSQIVAPVQAAAAVPQSAAETPVVVAQAVPVPIASTKAVHTCKYRGMSLHPRPALRSRGRCPRTA